MKSINKRIVALILSALLLWILSCPNGISVAYSAEDSFSIGNADAGVNDVVPGEFLVSAESVEQAKQIALAYGLELKSYDYGIALLSAMNPEMTIKQNRSVYLSELPELYVNRLYSIYETNNFDDPVGELQYIPDYYIQYHHEEMDNPRAWELSTGEGVIVAIIDTGIDINHSAFAGRLSSISYNSYTGQTGLQYVKDTHGHGTHVCGIVSASLDITSGVFGVAPSVELMVIKADRSDNRFELVYLLRAINYAVENGADIINLSLGSAYSSGAAAIDHDTIINAVEKGVTVVCAAGNERANHAAYPAAYPETIAVSGLKQGYLFDNTYSNYGPEIDISAPGTAIYSTKKDGGYSYMSGTSMAAPCVTGVAALIKAFHPDYSPQQIKDTLIRTARDAGMLGRDEYYGHGVINAYAALLGADSLFNVSYEYNDGDRAMVSTKVVPGNRLLEPILPELEGNTFEGWHLDSAGRVLFDFNDAINNDITLYAKWEIPVLSAFTVSGIVCSYNPNIATTLTLFEDGVEKHVVTIQPLAGVGQFEQNFSFENVLPGNYSLEIVKDVHTKYTINNIIVSGDNVDLTQDSRNAVRLVTLLCGDISGDGEINQADLNLLWLPVNYNKRLPDAGNELCDLNGDGEINQLDLNILWLSANYNKSAVIIN